MKELFKRIKTVISQGLFLTLPLMILLLFIGWIINIFGDMSILISSRQKHPFLAILVFIFLSYFCGLFLNSKFGQKISKPDLLLSKIPIFGLAGRLINKARSISEGLKFPILIQYPRPHCWVIGFIMDKKAVIDSEGQQTDTVVRVYIPTAHVSGQSCHFLFSQNEEVFTGLTKAQANEEVLSLGFLEKEAATMTLKKTTLKEVVEKINM